MTRQIKPTFYDEFACIAGRCSLTCCQEWKIAVDDETYQKWKKITSEGEPNRSLASRTHMKEGQRVLRLNDHGRCPYLNEEKLCSLVIEHGEEILSKTCALFPRQVHEFENRREYALVSCCPQVIDLLWQEEAFRLVEVDETEADESGAMLEGTGKEEQDYRGDMSEQVRQFLLLMIQNKDYGISQNLMMLFYIVLDMYKEEQVTEQMLEEYVQKSTLEKLDSAISQMNFEMEHTLVERNELFLDLAENYRKEGLYTSYLGDIAELAERWSDEETTDEMILLYPDFQKELNKYERLYRSYLASECYTNVVIPDMEDLIEGVVVNLQWIAMEYAVIRHALFLRWILDGKGELAYETVRNYLVVISRMMGYDEEDIVEYLENSFQELVWDWGYYALITGEVEHE